MVQENTKQNRATVTGGAVAFFEDISGASTAHPKSPESENVQVSAS